MPTIDQMLGVTLLAQQTLFSLADFPDLDSVQLKASVKLVALTAVVEYAEFESGTTLAALLALDTGEHAANLTMLSRTGGLVAQLQYMAQVAEIEVCGDGSATGPLVLRVTYNLTKV